MKKWTRGRAGLKEEEEAFACSAAALASCEQTTTTTTATTVTAAINTWNGGWRVICVRECAWWVQALGVETKPKREF